MNGRKIKNFGLYGNVKYYAIGVGVAICISAMIMAMFALLMMFVDLNDFAVDLLGIIALSAGTLLGSYIVGSKIKKGGLLVGTVNGSLIVMLNFLIGIIFNGLNFTPTFFVKILSIIISSLIGGVYAVNKVAKRRI